MKKIVLKINKNGSVEAKIEGVKGKGCLEYIALLEELLDGETYEHKLTHEYYEEELNLDTNTSSTIKINEN